MIPFIDTHAHLDGTEFAEDRATVVQRAKDAGASQVFIPAIDLPSLDTVMDFCRQFPDFAYPMVGLHPEEVKADWQEVLSAMHPHLSDVGVIAIGEVGLDFYWSREFEKEQMTAFEEQVRWSVETRLPLMIHCRKAQNELVGILRRYQKELPGGVFHWSLRILCWASEVYSPLRSRICPRSCLLLSHSVVLCWKQMLPIWHPSPSAANAMRVLSFLISLPVWLMPMG